MKWSYLEGVCECVAASVITVLLVGLILKCCFMFTETVRLIRDFHTAPELCRLMLMLIAFIQRCSPLSSRLAALLCD